MPSPTDPKGRALDCLTTTTAAGVTVLVRDPVTHQPLCTVRLRRDELRRHLDHADLMARVEGDDDDGAGAGRLPDTAVVE